MMVPLVNAGRSSLGFQQYSEEEQGVGVGNKTDWHICLSIFKLIQLATELEALKPAINGRRYEGEYFQLASYLYRAEVCLFLWLCILNISFEGTGEWTFNLESLRYRVWEHCQRAVDKSCMWVSLRCSSQNPQFIRCWMRKYTHKYRLWQPVCTELIVTVSVCPEMNLLRGWQDVKSNHWLTDTVAAALTDFRDLGSITKFAMPRRMTPLKVIRRRNL